MVIFDFQCKRVWNGHIKISTIFWVIQDKKKLCIDNKLVLLSVELYNYMLQIHFQTHRFQYYLHGRFPLLIAVGIENNNISIHQWSKI